MDLLLSGRTCKARVDSRVVWSSDMVVLPEVHWGLPRRLEEVIRVRWGSWYSQPCIHELLIAGNDRPFDFTCTRHILTSGDTCNVSPRLAKRPGHLTLTCPPLFRSEVPFSRRIWTSCLIRLITKDLEITYFWVGVWRSVNVAHRRGFRLLTGPSSEHQRYICLPINTPAPLLLTVTHTPKKHPTTCTRF